MKIACTYENGLVFQHFGHTEQFKLYETDGNRIVATEIIDTNGSGHGALAGFLAQRGVDVLICGGIGPGAVMALQESGIRLCAGISGSADGAVQAMLDGVLSYSVTSNCSHHEGEHSCGKHSCGEHSCH